MRSRAEVSQARVAAVREVRRFEREAASPKEVSAFILFKFVTDLTSGFTRRIIDVQYRQEHLTRRNISHTLKICGACLCVSVVVGMVVYLCLFASRQGRDRQYAWFYASMLWLGVDVCFLSSVVVLVQHVLLPSLAIADLNAAIRHVNAKIGPYAKRQVTFATEEEAPNLPVIQEHNEQQTRAARAFNAAQFIYVSHRLASVYPKSEASRIVRKYSTVWPRGCAHLQDTVGGASDRSGNERLDREGGCGALAACMSLLALLLRLPLLLQQSLFRALSTFTSGVLLFVHIYLYNMFPALVVLPLYTVLILWLLAKWRSHIIQSQRKNTIIAVKPLEIDLEAGRSDGVTPLPTIEDVPHCDCDCEEKDEVPAEQLPGDVISEMSADMSNFDRAIVRDVLRSMAEEVDSRGLTHVLDDNQAYFSTIDTISRAVDQFMESPEVLALNNIDAALSTIVFPEAEVLANLNLVMSVLDNSKEGEGSLPHMSRYSIDCVNTLTEMPIGSVSNTGLSFDEWSRAIEYKRLSVGQIKSKVTKKGYRDDDVETFYPAGQLEDDDCTLTSEVKLSLGRGGSVEIASGVVEEDTSQPSRSSPVRAAENAMAVQVVKRILDIAVQSSLDANTTDVGGSKDSSGGSSPPSPASEACRRSGGSSTPACLPVHRKDELLSDVKRIVLLSKWKNKKKDPAAGDIDIEGDEVNIVPVFSAWCDNVMNELNSHDAQKDGRKLKTNRCPGQGRECGITG